MKYGARRATIALASVLALSGCSGKSRTGTGPSEAANPAGSDAGSGVPAATPTLASSPATRAVPARIDGVGGEVVAIQLDAAEAKSGRLRIRLDDGTDVPVKTYQIQAKPSSTVDPWMGTTAEWTTQPIETMHGESVLAIFTLPKQAKGQGIWIGESRHDVQWLSSPEAIVGADSIGVWKPTLPPAATGNPGLMRRLRDAAKSPLSRWRVRLVLDGMRSAVPPTRFDDRNIEAWATYTEELWRIAFARLALADADVCERLRTRLSAIVDFGGGVFAPAWPTDQRAIDRLLSELLSPTGPSGGVAARAAQFLAEQPQGVIWVVDDGGVLGGGKGPDRRPLPLIGVANFSGRDALAFGYMGEEPARPDLVPAKAYSAQILTITDVGNESVVNVRLSKWTATIPVAIAPLAVIPPGLQIGPLVPDLSMDRWLYALPASAPGSIATTALLHRPMPGPDGERRWELFVECRVPMDSGKTPTTAEDRVCICMGPPGMPGGMVCVDKNGAVSTRLTEREAVGPPAVVPIASSADRWSFRLTLPASAIEQGERVRLGLVRRTSQGRFAWPRPLLPWQEFPSRALVDLSTWTGFESAER